MSCDLEAMVFTSRVELLREEVQPPPGGGRVAGEGAQLSDVAFKAHQFLVDGQTVGHDRRFLHKADSSIWPPRSSSTLARRRSRVGDERLRRARGDGAGDLLQSVGAGVQIPLQGLALDRAMAAASSSAPSSVSSSNARSASRSSSASTTCTTSGKRQNAHHRAVVRQAGEPVRGAQIGADEPLVHLHRARVLR